MATQFEIIARSGTTPIPGGVGAFTGFSNKPSVDHLGNAVFTGTGGPTGTDTIQSGFYRSSPANVLSQIVKRGMPAPDGGTFVTVYGADLNDVDGNNMAFLANTAAIGTLKKMFHNIGGTLVVVDGIVNPPGQPYLGNGVLAFRTTKDGAPRILRYPGGTSVDPGAGASVSPSTECAISGNKTIFRRASVTGPNDIAIIDADGVDSVVQRLGPSPDGSTYNLLGFFPALDGDNCAFFCQTNKPTQGVHKRVGGVLSVVANQQTPVPGAPGKAFLLFDVSSIAIVGDAVFFGANLTNGLYGIFTDLGGTLDALVISGQVFDWGTPSRTWLSGKGVAKTSRGYEIVFNATMTGGGTLLVRAIIPSDTPPPPVKADYDVTIDDDSATLTSTRGSVNIPTQPLPAEFRIAEVDGERILRVKEV